MALIPEQDRKFLQEHFEKELKDPVKVLYFTQHESPLVVPGAVAEECAYCRETRQLLEELTSLSPKLELSVHDFVGEAQLAEQYRVDKIPAIVITKGAVNNLRYYGVPSGYEFATLIEALLDVSKGESNLSAKTKQALASLDKDVHIQVLVTPT